MKSRMSSNFGQIRPLPTELSALERLKISRRLIMGKWFLQANSFIFIGSSSNLLVIRTGIKSRTIRIRAGSDHSLLSYMYLPLSDENFAENDVSTLKRSVLILSS